MSLPDLLKQGINERDWNKVDEAYKLLTGISILNSTEIDKTVEEDKGDGSESFVASSYKNGESYEKTNTSGAARREAMDINNRKNSWVDDGTIAANEMVSKDPSLGVANPVARNRPPAAKRSNQDGEIRVDRSSKLEK